jgi:hypothetical protein
MDMTDDAEKFAALPKKVDDLTAKHIALEAVFEHLTVPVYLAVRCAQRPSLAASISFLDLGGRQIFTSLTQLC